MVNGSSTASSGLPQERVATNNEENLLALVRQVVLEGEAEAEEEEAEREKAADANHILARDTGNRAAPQIE